MPSSVKFFSTPDALYSELGCKKGAKPGSGKLDAVIISTETDSHERLCIQAIGLGLHVLLEKPISIGLEAHHRVIEAAKKRPEVKVLIALSRRFGECSLSLFIGKNLCSHFYKSFPLFHLQILLTKLLRPGSSKGIWVNLS